MVSLRNKKNYIKNSILIYYLIMVVFDICRFSAIFRGTKTSIFYWSHKLLGSYGIYHPVTPVLRRLYPNHKIYLFLYQKLYTIVLAYRNKTDEGEVFNPYIVELNVVLNVSRTV